MSEATICRSIKPSLAPLYAYSPDLNPIEEAFAKVKALLYGEQEHAPVRRCWRPPGGR